MATTTEVSQTSFPQWTQDAYANTFQMGTGMLENFLRNPQYSVAGFTTDALKGMDLSRQTAQNVFTAPALTAPGSPNLTASTVGTEQINAGMNPYLQQVGNQAMDAMRREYGNTDAGLASKYAAAGAMGGSGAAIARGQAARGYNQNVGNAIAQLMSQGYDRATSLALANAQSENAMKNTAADYGLKQTQVNDALRTNQQNREMGITQQLQQQAGVQQNQAQRALDVPWTALERLYGITPKQLNQQTVSTKTTPDQGGGGLSSILGGITAGAGALKGLFGGGASSAAAGIAGLFGASDEREKVDIEKYGKPKAGEPQLYAYRYRGDPKSYVKVVGPMAQDVEEMRPDAVAEVDGRKVVKADILAALMASGKRKAA